MIKFLSKMIKNGFTEAEGKFAKRCLRLAAFFISIGYLFTVYLKYDISPLAAFSITARYRTPSEQILDMGALIAFVIVILIGLYWLINFLHSLYQTILPIGINFIYPIKNKIISFFYNMKNVFIDNVIWRMHLRWFQFFEQLGKRTLFFLLKYLEPELRNKESLEDFQSASLILRSPHHYSSKFIQRVRDRYERFYLLATLIYGFVLWPIFMIFLFFIVYLIRPTIFLALVSIWYTLLFCTAFWGYNNPIRSRSDAWYKEYRAANSRESIIQTIDYIEQQLNQQDSRIERLKELSKFSAQEFIGKNVENESVKQEIPDLITSFQDTVITLRQSLESVSKDLEKTREDNEKTRKNSEKLKRFSILSVVVNIILSITTSVLASFIYAFLSASGQGR